jgi:hypothetical protein
MLQGVQGEVVGTDCPRIRIASTADEKSEVKAIIENHHSYVPTYRSVGRRIDWIVTLEGKTVGMVGIGSATYPPSKDMLLYLGMTKEEYRQFFNSFANNWRFCMTEQRFNLGSQVLKLVRENAGKAWEEKYGNTLTHIFTFVGAGKTGAVYKADNWTEIGLTAGLPKGKKSVSMKWNSSSELSHLFIKPTGEDRKRIFVTNKIGGSQ